MIFFDYVFYRVCKAYLQTKSTSPEATAAIIVAVMQCFNIVSIAMLIEIVRHEKSILSKTVVVVLVMLLMTINYMRYVYKVTHGYKVMSERYVNERRYTTKGTLVLLYIIFSTGLAFGLAIFEGYQTW